MRSFTHETNLYVHQTTADALTQTLISNPRVQTEKNDSLFFLAIVADWETTQQVDPSSLIQVSGNVSQR